MFPRPASARSRRRPPPRSFARSCLLLVALAAAGCAPRAGDRAAAPAEPDTLANGLPRALAARLGEWQACWRRANPAFAPESLACVGRDSLRFESAGPAGGRRFAEDARSRALLVVLSPDSTRLLDVDRYLGAESVEGGRIARGPDSAPELVDFAADSLWTVGFCGPSCFYDGGFWLDRDRFALTGATQSGEQADGPWQAFVECYDLRTRRRVRWLGRPVEEAAFDRFRAASDALLSARLAPVVVALPPRGSSAAPLAAALAD